MKYEFVEFYPFTPDVKKNAKALGTCHIYVCELDADIRGILVLKYKNGLIFKFPHFKYRDEENGKIKQYPLFRFNSEEKQKELWDFMFEEVAPAIKEKLHQPKKKIA